MKQIAFLLLFLLIACKPAEIDLTAQQIIDKSMHNSGTNKIANSNITFTFRAKEYAAIRKNGKFELSKKYDTTDGIKIEEVLSNNGYQRFRNNKTVVVPDSLIAKYSNAVNSVHYFSVLPFSLNDTAVRKKLLKTARIKGKEYYKLEISFSENGGGEDFEDVFIYWIGKENFLIDYLAYSYHTNRGGMRFRALKNHSSIQGVRFVNYDNYKPIDPSIQLTAIDDAFESDQVKKVSEIVLEAIEVQF